MTLRQIIENGVRRFNEYLPYRAWDYLVYNCFQSTCGVPENRDDKQAHLSARIEAIVWLFQVPSMRTWKHGASDDIRHRVATGDFADYYWNLVNNEIGQDIDNESKQLIFKGTVAKLKDAIGKAKEETRGAFWKDKDNQAVFCSKLLHWTFPETFPMIDNNVVKTIKERHRLARMEPLSNKLCSDRIRAYPYVIKFCASVQKELDVGAREYLMNLDRETQPQDFLRVPNTWLRVVDKWLWIEGK